MPRISGLNTLRFVCAIWVVISHLGLPYFSLLDSHNGFVARSLKIILENSFSGVCAVIAFFVISGICIHISYSKDLRIKSLSEYFTRRFVRILPPLLVAAAVGYKLHYSLHVLILWSLYCELWYYLIYPILLILRRNGTPWISIVGVSFIGSLLVMLTHREARNFYDPGIWLTWILGLPCWLMGCVIAEKWQEGSISGTRRIGAWRLLVWSGSVGCSLLRFHSPIGYVWTLPFFGIAIASWISKEIANHRESRPLASLEWLGEWSFSLYLVHMLGFAVCNLIVMKSSEPLVWLMHLMFALGIGYLFAVLVEFPSHKVAKVLARRFRGA